MAWRIDRRQFLGWAAAFAAGCQTKHRCGGEIVPGDIQSATTGSTISLSGAPFTLGVASGDPNATSVILWTRLAPEPLSGGGMPSEEVDVAWQVARDAEFNDVVGQGVAVASPQYAHSLHIDVQGLESDAWYFYRFLVADFVSPTGRTRTLPCEDDSPERLAFSVACCQKYRSGYFNAHARMAEEDVDFCVFVGDYIYESGGNGDIPERNVEPVAVVDLEGYRARHALYKTDSALQAAHAACPWIATWDDHEVRNDYAGGWSPDEDEDEVALRARRAAAYQAYYEHLPLRLPPPRGDTYPIHRSFQFGDLATFFMLDARQYRDPPPCEMKIGPACPERENDALTFLGAEQEKWVVDGLAASTTRWKFLAQQVVMTALDFGGTIVNSDQWDGFPAARQRLLDEIRNHDGVVVLSGDIHAALVNDLWALGGTRSRVVATELVTTSISSGGDGSDENLIGELVGGVENVHYFNAQRRGYLLCIVGRDHMEATFRVVDTVLSPSRNVDIETAWEIALDEPGAKPIDTPTLR